MSVHFCQSKNEPKRAPRCPGLSGYPALLAVDGTLKTHPPTADSNKSSVFIPSTTAMLSGTEWGFQNK